MTIKLTIFKIPNHRMVVLKDKVVFRHDWEGQDMYWFVPMSYVIHMKPGPVEWELRVSRDYFDINTQVTARRFTA